MNYVTIHNKKQTKDRQHVCWHVSSIGLNVVASIIFFNFRTILDLITADATAFSTLCFRSNVASRRCQELGNGAFSKLIQFFRWKNIKEQNHQDSPESNAKSNMSISRNHPPPVTHKSHDWQTIDRADNQTEETTKICSINFRLNWIWCIHSWIWFGFLRIKKNKSIFDIRRF